MQTSTDRHPDGNVPTDALQETGRNCPVTGRPFLSAPAFEIDRSRFGSRLELFSGRIVVDRVRGHATKEDIRGCMANFDRFLDRIPGNVILVEDFSTIQSVESDARRYYESELFARRDRIQGVVFFGLGPMFRLFLRMARRLHQVPFPLHTAQTWAEVVEISTSILEGRIRSASEYRRPLQKRRLPIPAFLLKGYAEELRNIVSDMPWDGTGEALNPLPGSHPFHDVVEAWVAVKHDLDWLDQQRQEREQELRSTALTLADSEGRYRAVFEASGTALVLYGADRMIQMVNRATEKMAKVSRNQIEGQFDWMRFIHPDDVENLRSRHHRRQVNPRLDMGRLECRVVDAEGHVHWAEVTVESIPGTDLRVASLDDRTEYREAHLALEDSERRFRQIVETSLEGIWTADVAGRTTWTNGRMLELLGCSAEQVAGQSFLELLPPLAEKRLEVLQSLLEGNSVVFEGRLPRFDGKAGWAIVSASPIGDKTGATSGFFAMCTDITRRHEAETALRDLARDLETRVSDRTAELEAANGELARALRAREDFLAAMSHELRTPLAAVLGALEVVREVDEPARIGRLLDVAERNGRQLLSLIEDVLDFARGRAGALSIEPASIEAGEALQAVCQALEVQATRAGMRLQTEPCAEALPVLADPLRLRQILTNFVVNAIRHAAGGGVVEVSARSDPFRIHFEVRDLGPGVPPKDADRLFQPFVQLTGRLRGGAGLGLALSSQLAQSMGGEVGYSPRPGGGSIFWLQLPKGEPSSVVGSDSHAVAGGSVVGGKIFLVEDQEDLRDILHDHLAQVGWVVASFRDGGTALEAVSRESPDIVVVDLGLPDIDGLEVIGRLAGLDRDRAPGILALTGQAYPEDAERCHKAGADRFLTKPTSLRRMDEVLQDLVQIVRQRRSAV